MKRVLVISLPSTLLLISELSSHIPGASVLGEGLAFIAGERGCVCPLPVLLMIGWLISPW